MLLDACHTHTCKRFSIARFATTETPLVAYMVMPVQTAAMAVYLCYKLASQPFFFANTDRHVQGVSQGKKLLNSHIPKSLHSRENNFTFQFWMFSARAWPIAVTKMNLSFFSHNKSAKYFSALSFQRSEQDRCSWFFVRYKFLCESVQRSYVDMDRCTYTYSYEGTVGPLWASLNDQDWISRFRDWQSDHSHFHYWQRQHS